MRLLRANCPARPGKVIPLVAISLVGIMGVLSIALEGGLLLERRRQVHTASDVAALAAAVDLYSKFQSNLGKDVGGTAVLRAREAAAAQGFVHGQDGVTVTVNVPPTSGDHAGQDGHAE